MLTDREWEKIREEKQKNISKYVDRKEININTLACMHDAVAITIARNSKLKAGLDTKDEYLEEIKYWLDTLLKMAKAKVSYESIPVIEESQITEAELEEKRKLGLKWQEDYNETTKAQDIKEELTIIDEEI